MSMIDKNSQYNVRNRSTDTVVYSIPEMNVRRLFTPGETKKITYGELEALSFAPGGKELMAQYLQIRSIEVLEELNINTEAEYFMDKDQVIELIRTGSVDQWIDALNFAPAGVIELMKRFSVDLPLHDRNKVQIMKDMIGFDVDAAIKNSAKDAEDEAPVAQAGPTRRASSAIIDESAKGEAQTPSRRSSGTVV